MTSVEEGHDVIGLGFRSFRLVGENILKTHLCLLTILLFSVSSQFRLLTMLCYSCLYHPPTRYVRIRYWTTVVYYESRKRELKIRLMNEGRCDERQKARVEESTWLTYTGLRDKTN